jgi:hypothetical protein
MDDNGTSSYPFQVSDVTNRMRTAVSAWSTVILRIKKSNVNRFFFLPAAPGRGDTESSLSLYHATTKFSDTVVERQRQ